MRSGLFIKLGLGFYLVLFFGYLLGPLVIMGITAFNSPGFPRAAPFECLTFEWFGVLLEDERILNGLKNSFIVGAGTVTLSVMLGLAGALMLTQIWPKLRATFYTIIIAPILIPGVVLGISTLIFWDRINVALGLPNDSILHNGLFLTIIGQSTFIASYCMLIFIARLQRFDPALTEAALDLGASHTQAFRKILLPFLAPAILSAAVIAFLASFENYNTTTFTFGKYPTLTIELAQKVRYGINPSISALAVIIVAMTVLFALGSEVMQRRKALAVSGGLGASAPQGGGSILPRWLSNPAGIALGVLLIGIVATMAYASAYSPDVCKAEVRAEKQLLQQQRIDEIQRQRRERQQEKLRAGPDVFGDSTDDRTGGGDDSGFGGVFAPGNLQGDAPEAPKPDSGFGGAFAPGNLQDEEPAPESESAAPSTDGGAFGGVFAPGNLQSAEPAAEEEAPAAPGGGMFQDVFDPTNLQGDGQ